MRNGSTAATALLVWPSAYHRLRRQHDKESDMLFHSAAAAVVTAAVGAFFRLVLVGPAAVAGE